MVSQTPSLSILPVTTSQVRGNHVACLGTVLSRSVNTSSLHPEVKGLFTSQDWAAVRGLLLRRRSKCSRREVKAGFFPPLPRAAVLASVPKRADKPGEMAQYSIMYCNAGQNKHQLEYPSTCSAWHRKWSLLLSRAEAYGRGTED